MTTPEVAKAPALFLRNATGLVKGWSAFDAFGYSFFSVNLVTLGMFYSLAIFAFVPDGSVLSALVLSGVTMTFLCIVYAGLIAVMPRAGGDYVWQTRIFDGVPGAVVAARGRRADRLPRCERVRPRRHDRHRRRRRRRSSIGAVLGMRRGGIGFVLSSTGWWFILALWAPIYGYILNIEVAPAARGDRRRRPTCSTFLGVTGRDVHRLDHHDRHRLGRGRPGHGRLRPDPAGEPLHRPRSRWP